MKVVLAQLINSRYPHPDDPAAFIALVRLIWFTLTVTGGENSYSRLDDLGKTKGKKIRTEIL